MENEPNFQSREHCADYIPVRIQINELVEPNDDHEKVNNKFYNSVFSICMYRVWIMPVTRIIKNNKDK